MSSFSAPADCHTIPVGRTVRGLCTGGLLGALNQVQAESQGGIGQLRLGPFRPLVVSHPDHLDHILRRNSGNYTRGTALWKALRRLTGNGITGEGDPWRVSRDIIQSGLSARCLQEMGDQMLTAMTDAVEDLGRRALHEGPVDSLVEMQRIVHRVINPVFFGSRIPQSQCDRLGAAVSTALRGAMRRMAVPFVPLAVPMPGDRSFHRGRNTVFEILRPVIEHARTQPRNGADLMTRMLNGTHADGRPLSADHITHDVIALFFAGSETSAATLNWVWLLLGRHPEAAAEVRRETERVLAGGPPRREHVRQLTYTQMVISEVMRLYPMAWMLGRTAIGDDVIDGTPVRAGTTLALSPFLTHRLPQFWERPLEFAPERFTRQAIRARHPLAYLPFGDGAHSCVGQSFFTQEATLVLATMMNRYDVTVLNAVTPRFTWTMNPCERVRLLLRPRS
ncbi:cytochrome P450 [Streptomyces sp. A3M-1-3]|uniref:cytochrome P450 n=1 Tax=Streptomyces sp. A3M-1-3 TaxID=2962044 RepID=UPI0020B77420|nr:cytochrome P450 [Streptomyces sp. A3M-1-3]MCP3819380.1 cytochrome P450 [Streptomyces sp. A3M-1-3]